MPRRSLRVSRYTNGISSEDTHSHHDSPSEQEESHIDIIKNSLIKAEKSLKQLEKQLGDVNRENERLKNQLRLQEEQTIQNSSPRRAQPRRRDIERINVLETKIGELKALNRKNQRRIDRLRSKEVKEEANDLEQTAEEAALGDSTYRMRKLLRRFNDLMLVVTLGEKEECPVCLEIMVLKETSSMPCEHLICNTCLPGISRGADETVKCPSCRGTWGRDEIKIVDMNETTRWDSLLQVAQAFSAMDTRGEMETEEEEDEENFIDDGSETENTSGKQELSSRESSEMPPASEESVPGTPELRQRRFYSESPTKDKRKRMERLAEERANKRSRA